MKVPVLLLGLTCALWGQGALATPEQARKAPQSLTATHPEKAKSHSPAKPAKSLPPKPVLSKPAKLPALPAKKPLSAAPVPVIQTPEDQRELIRMPSPARLALRAEMRDRLLALDSVLQLINDGKVSAAGAIAQERLGVAVWGRHGKLPAVAQPEQYMPKAMQTLALDGYKAASDFATVALTGDHLTAVALLSQLTGSCAQCHQTYRVR